MTHHRMAPLFAFGALLVVGCTRPAFQETLEDDGIITRVEIEAENQETANVSDAVVAQRLARYAQNKSATRERATILKAIAPAAAGAFDPFIERNCPPEGSAAIESHIRMNQLKNRVAEPSMSDINMNVSLDAMRASGNDRDRWSEGQAASVVGYVRSAKGTGRESCNCRAGTRRLTDMHLDIIAGPDDNRRPVIAEITVPLRLIHEHFQLEDWSSRAIKDKYEGKTVRITGWLFYDRSHESGAENIDPGDMRGEKNWRATCWEIHPITHIELIEP